MSQRTLDQLFLDLVAETRQESLRELQELIWDKWMFHENDYLRALMEKGIQVMGEGEMNEAIASFSQVIDLDPAYPEGWNKRATAFFLRGNYKNSIEDITQALVLEPRHFGALSGLASIYLTIGDKKKALRSLQTILSLMPHDDRIQEQVDAIEDQEE
ncbi:MAG: hypothetical protein AAF399_16210 [Bacteroidota bacterium]